MSASHVHGLIFDELHAQPNRLLWDTLTTGTAARRQPLIVALTTAGYDRNSICWEQHEYAKNVLAGIIEDDSFLPVIHAADDDDDWTKPKTWKKANPNLDVTVKRDYLQQECKRAQESPAYENTFRRLHLNQWTEQAERWLSMAAWDACDGEVDQRALEASECYAGLDLASTTDIAALTLVFPDGDGGCQVLPFFWVPEENLQQRMRRDRVTYDLWVQQGLIAATPGNVIDFDRIRRRVNELGQRYNIREIAIDRWNATQLSMQLDGDGFTVIAFGQGYYSMAAPTKDLLTLALSGKLRHGGHPVLRWMASNLAVEQDASGNVKPSKKKSTERIDGMVALIMALDRMARHQGDADERSVYEDRGILWL